MIFLLLFLIIDIILIFKIIFILLTVHFILVFLFYILIINFFLTLWKSKCNFIFQNFILVFLKFSQNIWDRFFKIKILLIKISRRFQSKMTIMFLGKTVLVFSKKTIIRCMMNNFLTIIFKCISDKWVL